MLSRLRTPRLCGACQGNILAIFENGFCESSKVRPALLPLRQLQRPARGFSNSRALRRNEPITDPRSTEAAYKNEGVLETDRFLTELQALEEIEKELSEPSDQNEHFARGRRGEDPNAITAEDDVEDGLFVEGEDLFAVLRSSGASLESIVREARQIYGESLPDGVLDEKEYQVYLRLYGEPAEEVEEDFEEALDPEEGVDDLEESTIEVLNRDGKPIAGADITTPASTVLAAHTAMSDGAIVPSNRAQQIAEQLGGEVYDADEAEADQDDEYSASEPRAHPLTSLGRFSTYPRTVFLPQEAFIKPVEGILSAYSNKQLKEMCERTFGGGGLPDSPLTPRSGRTMQQVPIPLQASQHTMGEMEANAFVTAVMPSTYAAIMSVLVETRKRLGSSWLRKLLAREDGPRILDAGAGGAGIVAWRETVKAEWNSLHSSDRDAPPAPLGKAIVLTSSDTVRHRAATLLENTTFIPRLPDYVHVRDSATLEDDRPAPQRKEFDIIIASHALWPFREDWERKQYVQNLWSLLNPTGGILILIEKGVPRGFEAIAGAREFLLDRYIASPESETYENTLDSASSDVAPQTQKGKGMIVAPCTNHSKCPMYPIPGISRGRKDYCAFQQRYIRPPFLQRVLGAKDRSHDDADFSYISVMKGEDLRKRQPATLAELVDLSSSSAQTTAISAQRSPKESTDAAFAGYEHDQILSSDHTGVRMARDADADARPELSSMLTLPRLVYPPLKRRGHVTFDVCTPAGTIERWTVPKSFSKQAYRDARKASWGDLWALGAKTRVPANLRLGGPGTKDRSKKDRVTDREEEIREEMEEGMLAKLEIEGERERVERGELDPFDEADDEENVIDEAAFQIKPVKKRAGNQNQKPRSDGRPQPVFANVAARRRAADAEDPEVARALGEWEDEFAADKRVGKKNVLSVREGTKEKMQGLKMKETRRRRSLRGP